MRSTAGLPAGVAAALKSAVALPALEPSLLAVGHGDAVSQPVAAMDQVIERARRAFSSPAVGNG